jgi:hypothetical protein
MQTDMATEQDYRERAKACIELAVTARTKEQSVMLEHIANTWLRLADEVRMPGAYTMLSTSTHAKP